MSADAVPDKVERGPDGTRFDEIRRFTSIDSTNRYLLDEARHAPRHGLVVVADHQTAGRGRLGRRWEAPPGANLLVSVLLCPDPPVPVDSLHLCSVAVALAAADACHELAGIEVSLKWPNDLVARGRKLAGILAESVPVARGQAGEADAGAPERAVVVGIGLNLRWPPPDGHPAGADVSADLRDTATSVWRETGADVSPDDALGSLLRLLDPLASALSTSEGRARLTQDYCRRCGTLGRRVRVSLAEDEIVGTAADITPEGHLVVETGACLTTVTAGDVVHLRGDDS